MPVLDQPSVGESMDTDCKLSPQPSLFSKSPADSLSSLVVTIPPVQAKQITRIFPPSATTIAHPHTGDPVCPIGPEEIATAQGKVEQDIPKFGEALRALREAPLQDVDMDAGEHYGIVVTPLGTGSAIPSKHRNGECIHY